jgi:hypothetical protein
VIAALLIAVLGLNLLAEMLEAAGDSILAPSGMALTLIGAGVVLFAETYSISRQEWIYAPTVAFVVLAFLAQALLGLRCSARVFYPGGLDGQPSFGIWAGWWCCP